MTHHLYHYTGNQIEQLFQEGVVPLIKNLHQDDPFTQSVFLIQGRGMERWLQQQLSQTFGCWLGGQFLLPQNFFDQLTSQLNTQLNHYSLQRKNLVELWKTNI